MKDQSVYSFCIPHSALKILWEICEPVRHNYHTDDGLCRALDAYAVHMGADLIGRTRKSLSRLKR